MSLTATPQPSNTPPRVLLDLDTDDAGGSFTEITVTRNGVPLRQQPPVGGPVSVALDYEAPFGQLVTYAAEGSFIPSATPDWTEAWASLASWTGDTGDFSVAGGKALSSVANADIVRSASGTIQKVSVALPDYVRVELLDAANAVVCSVSVMSNVTVSGTSSQSATGSGSFVLTLAAGTATAQAVDASWTVSVPYAGTPTKVRLVSLSPTVAPGLVWTSAAPYSVWVDAAGNVFVTDYSNTLIRKYNAAGVQQASWSTTGSPVGVWGDTSGNIFVIDDDNNLVRKYNSAGVQQTTWTTTGAPLGIWGDTSGNIFVADVANSLVRKYNSAGVQQTTWTTTGSPAGIWGDTSGNIFVTDITNKLVRKYNSSGVQQASWTTTGTAYSLWGDTAGNIFVSDFTNARARKYNSTGVQQASWVIAGSPAGIWGDSTGNVFVVDTANQAVRKYVPKTASVDDIITTLVTGEEPFSATTTTTLDVDTAWLIHPIYASLSTQIDPGIGGTADIYAEADAGEVKSSDADRTLHRPIGRRTAIVVTHGPRQADEWTLVLRAETIAAKTAIRALVDDQTPLLLRAKATFGSDKPGGWDLPDGWYSVGDLRIERPEVPLVDASSIISLPLTPSDPPVVRLAAVWTIGDTLLGYPTIGDGMAAFPTVLDALVGP